ncbi:hypothetical protein TEA_003797 [Camellia sinensis var. sinensis]|uniref:WAT1-related protein n=1 Tax=Camellia sinensis var. sinensis TaxID=542762 RepID=A0A4S4DX37_CAMSN|nr:hypothetical protein TEA_003797 [Camellia sinensis var. sinensis]
MGKITNTLNGLKPAMAMVVVQAALAGNSVFIKLASRIGLSMRVLTAYRFVFATAIIVPLALLLERKIYINKEELGAITSSNLLIGEKPTRKEKYKSRRKKKTDQTALPRVESSCHSERWMTAGSYAPDQRSNQQ